MEMREDKAGDEEDKREVVFMNLDKTFTACTGRLIERPGAKVITREIIVAGNHIGASNPNAPITAALVLLAGSAGCVSVYWNPYMSCGIAAKLLLEAALPAVDWKAGAVCSWRHRNLLPPALSS